MKNLFRSAFLMFGFLIVLSSLNFGQNAQNKTIEGHWLGAIEFSGTKLRLVLKVTKNADGTFSAKFDSPDQGANNLPLDSIAQQAKTVTFAGKDYGLSYEGTLNEAGDEITGTLKQGPGALPLVFKRTTEIVKLNRPQDPQKPYPYDEEDVVYENKADNVKLAGTLTIPRGAKSSPAVILITGSGSQDRNETVFGHRPFLVLADYLTRRGIAVLRVDDRGIGGSSAGASTATTENFAGDILAGIEFLKAHKEINPKQIGLIGHSEGGMVAPIVAARSKDVAFIVLMAGLGQTGEDGLYSQTELLQKAEGVSPETTKQTNAALKNIFTILRTEKDNKIAEQKIRETIEKQKSAMSDEQRLQFAPVEATFKAQTPMYLTQWFRYFVAFNPRPTLEKVKVPVLALNGENDLQVAPKENLSLIEAGIKAGGNKDVTIVSLPKLNHLFQTSEKGTLAEYGKIEETIAPVALETISNWILKRTAGK
jgi:pimeloyl-ACP methyl ester carboxylesterase